MTVRVKICGITRAEDALLATELGASAIGLVFWPGSPRFVDPEHARTIVDALPPDVTAVGVFVDQPAEYVRDVAARVPLGAVQLHGAEAVGLYSDIGARLIKAVSVRDDGDGDEAAGVPSHVTVLLDAHDPVKRGGTGRTIDWSVAARIARSRRTILSGGLTAANVRTAVQVVRPYMVDVSSGVESSPGRKDAGALRAFFEQL